MHFVLDRVYNIFGDYFNTSNELSDARKNLAKLTGERYRLAGLKDSELYRLFRVERRWKPRSR